MPTIIGLIFFCCGAYCFLFKEDSLLGLLIIASSFEASSAINFGERGIQPYYIIAGFIIVRAVVNWSFGVRRNKSMPHGRWLLLFGFVGVASAFILPIVFSGIPVYDPKIGIDGGLLLRPPLKFGLNNIGQAGFLAWHIVTAYAVLMIDFSAKKTRRAYICAFSIIMLFVLAQSLFQVANVPFPDSVDSLVRNNPGYAIADETMLASGTRNSGTCTEPSIAGGFLVLYCVGFLAEYLAGKGKVSKVIVALMACGLVASSGSMLTLCLIVPVLMVCYSPIRFTWHFTWRVNFRQMKRIVWILVLISVPLVLVLLAVPDYRQTLTTHTVSKADQGSFINRTAADMYALQLLPDTHWIGLGLGSNRASSMLATLLSNVGIVGVLIFGTYVFRLLTGLKEKDTWLGWAIFALLLNMCLGIADVTMPLLWMPILLAIELSSQAKDGPFREGHATVNQAAGQTHLVPE